MEATPAGATGRPTPPDRTRHTSPATGVPPAETHRTAPPRPSSTTRPALPERPDTAAPPPIPPPTRGGVSRINWSRSVTHQPVPDIPAYPIGDHFRYVSKGRPP